MNFKRTMAKAMIFSAAIAIAVQAQNWTAVGEGVGTGGSASVDVMTTYKNVLLAAGRYQSIQQWDGTAWADFATGSPSATALLADGDTLYAGGQFTGGDAAKVIRMYDGTAWSTFGGGVSAYDSVAWNTNNNYSAIFKLNNVLHAVYSGSLVRWNEATHKFSKAGGGTFAGIINNKAYLISQSIITVYDGSRRDTLDTSGYSLFQPLSAKVFNGELYLSGYFKKGPAVDPITTYHTLVKFDGTSFSEPAAEVSVSDPEKKTITGLFPAAGQLLAVYVEKGANYVGAYNGTSLSRLGDTIGTRVPNAMAVYNNEVYAGGFFSTFAGVATNNVAKIGLGSVGIRVSGKSGSRKAGFRVNDGFPISGRAVVSDEGNLFDLAGKRVRAMTIPAESIHR
ncbi:MAG: hypothetical protein JWO30_142 [Fibrobacteres bacterium]|nr:hypothetical protein [Fibrobacterota bacterium]